MCYLETLSACLCPLLSSACPPPPRSARPNHCPTLRPGRRLCLGCPPSPLPSQCPTLLTLCPGPLPTQLGTTPPPGALVLCRAPRRGNGYQQRKNAGLSEKFNPTRSRPPFLLTWTSLLTPCQALGLPSPPAGGAPRESPRRSSKEQSGSSKTSGRRGGGH